MFSIILRFILIFLVMWMSVLSLIPTYRWHFVFSNEQKQIASTSKKDLQLLTQNIENRAQYIRQAMGSSISTSKNKIATSIQNQKNNIFALDLSEETIMYIVDLEYNTLEQAIKKEINPNFQEFSLLRQNYTELQSYIKKYKDIKELQAIKNKAIKLGLDISGGVHFSLGIDQEQVNKTIEEQYKSLLDPSKIRADLIAENASLSQEDLTKEINKKIETLEQEKQEKLSIQNSERISQALTKIRGRIDQFGVSEPSIVKGPNNTIVIELPGEKDTDSAKEIFTRVGVLSFHIVDENLMSQVPIDAQSMGYVINEGYAKALNTRDSTFLPVQKTNKFGQIITEGYLAINNTIGLTGDHMVNAQVDTDQLGQRVISFRLDSQGALLFGKLTKEAVNKRIAIVLDGKIQSAPYVNETILGGAGTISGDFTLEDASLLSTILKSGSLPVPLKIEEERIIGPSLGQTEVTKGIHATLIALSGIIIFMFIYYGFWGGLSVNIAQIFNIVIILSIMTQIGATLTLPGIVAIVLSIAMSIDANIIIHERIKEDLKKGYNIPSAIVSGYHSAFRTIIDSNITTFIPGLIIGAIGDGAVRGFGIVLMIGLIINLFTAVFCTRTFYDLVFRELKIKNIFWSRLHAK